METPTREQVQELALQFLGDAGVEVTVTDEGLATDHNVFGLEPLRSRLATCPQEEWVEMVRLHFEGLLSVDPVIPESFVEAQPRLRSAVIAERDLGMFEGALMERKIVDGLGERLMIRHGSMGMTVTEDVVGSWQIEVGRVWDEARERSVWDEPVIRDVFTRDSVSYTAIRGGIWTSSRVFDLDRFVDPRLDYGVLSVVAARDEVLFHQIKDNTFAEAAVAMIDHAVHAFGGAPYPVGCDLHWWCDGRLHRIGTPGADGYRYLRIPTFSETLGRLEEALDKTPPRTH